MNRLRPLLQKHACVAVVWTDGEWSVDIQKEVGEGETFDMPVIGAAYDPCLERAAMVALIRAHRSEKGTT